MTESEAPGEGGDPRVRPPDALVAEYDAGDTVVRQRNTIELPPDQWAKLDRDGGKWGVGGFVTRDGDVLLVREDAKASDWVLPGGMLEAGETHAEGAAREVREETGIAVDVESLAAVSEQTFVHAADDRRFEFYFATFDATPRAADPTPSDDPGLPDEDIAAVAWHADLPADVFDRELVRRLLAREG
ncbi:NUDIX domain-containing protein [Halomarina litorea]|uniref:NUDIX domain-containing protein n=1 Tax=Halomarina litorea TaxID=2961595 RepID=UPI0020C30213|nr:NUDIX domain-containing protein [Halomarina sp. BCD28]